jgi:hypothetical protein
MARSKANVRHEPPEVPGGRNLAALLESGLLGPVSTF